jgi:hypothetical protein
MSQDLPAPALTWADRLSPAARGIAILLSGLFLVFFAGALVGFLIAMLEEGGPHKPAGWAALAGIVAGLLGLLWLVIRLVRSWRVAGLSGFDRRYYRMWGAILGIGAAVGLAFALIEGTAGFTLPALASSNPIDPTVALAFSGLLLGAFVVTMVLYHRRIDDHEERAYLWASHVAFHVLAAALPVAWLLGRGGWIAPLGPPIVFTLLFASALLQLLVWLWLKFR